MNISEKHICEHCSKEFCSKATLIRHKKTTKSCLEIQGKEDVAMECINCKKFFAMQYYKQHIEKCDIVFEKVKNEYKEQQKEIEKIRGQNKKISETNSKLKTELQESRLVFNSLTINLRCSFLTL